MKFPYLVLKISVSATRTNHFQFPHEFPNVLKKEASCQYYLTLVLSLFGLYAMSNSFMIPWTVASARLLCPWDFPGKNTGVGCHFFLQKIFLNKGTNPSLQNWQVDSLLLRHQGSPHPGLGYGNSLYCNEF